MVCLLMTGFEPFDDAPANASWRAVRSMADNWSGPSLTTLQLPVRFEDAAAAIVEAAEQLRPDVVIAVGLAEGRSDVTPERIAINVRDARIPDNTGHQPIGESIDPNGPDGVFSSLPLRDCVADLAAAGIPASISNSAGTYVCNEVFYRLMGWATHRNQVRAGVRAGFVHVPQATEWARGEEPTRPLAELAQALTVIARRCLLAGTQSA